MCNVIFPVRKEFFFGNGKRVGICTLSSLDLLEKISQTTAIMDRVTIAGRLLSENKGIDAIIKFAFEHPDLERILICGKEVRGHRAGQALLSLAKNGTDSSGRIIGAAGPYPLLRSDSNAIARFRTTVKIVDLIGTTDMGTILRLVA